MGRRSSSASRSARPLARPRSAAAAAAAVAARSVVAAARPPRPPSRSGRLRGSRRPPSRPTSPPAAESPLGPIVDTDPALRDRRRRVRLFLGPPLCFRQPPPRRLGLGLTRRLGPPERGELFPLGLRRGPQRRELGQGVRELAIGLGDGRLEVEVACRDRRGRGAPLGGRLGFGGRPLIGQSDAISLDGFKLSGQPALSQLERRQRRSGRLMGGTPLALHRGPRGEVRGERGGRGLGGVEVSAGPTLPAHDRDPRSRR